MELTESARIAFDNYSEEYKKQIGYHIRLYLYPDSWQVKDPKINITLFSGYESSELKDYCDAYIYDVKSYLRKILQNPLYQQHRSKYTDELRYIDEVNSSNIRHSGSRENSVNISTSLYSKEIPDLSRGVSKNNQEYILPLDSIALGEKISIAKALFPIESRKGNRKIVTLCGSTRYAIQLFAIANLFLTSAGFLVFSIGCDTHSDLDLEVLGAMNSGKGDLEDVHFEKIKRSDAILVLNPIVSLDGGETLVDYIGESTGAEVALARKLEIPVWWLNQHTCSETCYCKS